MATGAAWLKGRNSRGEREKQNIHTRKKKRKNILDTHRPSHGRTWSLDLSLSRWDLSGN
jgi:hypothetical protein